MTGRAELEPAAYASPRQRVVPWPAAAVADLAAVVVFVAIGRRSHDESSALLGLASTAWPFLTGALLGWLLSRGWRAPAALAPTGLAVWLGCVAGGMVLRAVAGQGVAGSFVVVATVVLAVLLLGWRVVVRAAGRRRVDRSGPPTAS
jgi:peptidoglycan/LPS O-acetylase OafA/YrhL